MLKWSGFYYFSAKDSEDSLPQVTETNIGEQRSIIGKPKPAGKLANMLSIMISNICIISSPVYFSFDFMLRRKGIFSVLPIRNPATY